MALKTATKPQAGLKANRYPKQQQLLLHADDRGPAAADGAGTESRRKHLGAGDVKLKTGRWISHLRILQRFVLPVPLIAVHGGFFCTSHCQGSFHRQLLPPAPACLGLLLVPLHIPSPSGCPPELGVQGCGQAVTVPGPCCPQADICPQQSCSQSSQSPRRFPEQGGNCQRTQCCPSGDSVAVRPQFSLQDDCGAELTFPRSTLDVPESRSERVPPSFCV